MEQELKQKLDEALGELHDIKMTLRGDPDRPGIVQELATMRHVLYGNGTLGLIQKVGVIWRSYVWVLCTASGFAGSGITILVHHFLVGTT
jgi:hypothetical protein